MAKYTGAVRFSDGALMYFVYQGTVDIARPQLFKTPDAAFAAWDLPSHSLKTNSSSGEGETVEVMPYFMHGSEEVHFSSRADRAARLITGPLSLDSAQYENDRRHTPHWQ